MKTHKGRIINWTKLSCDPNPNPGEAEANLGYMIRGTHIMGQEIKSRNWRTSPVVKHENNQIETLNSIYDLGPEAK